jgi:hypothetical protein
MPSNTVVGFLSRPGRRYCFGIMEVDRNLALELSRQLLGLPEMKDKEALRVLVTERIDALNPIDHATFRMQLGRLYRETTSDEPLTPTFKVVGLVATLVFYAASTGILLHFIWTPGLSPLLKAALAFPALLLAVLTIGAITTNIRYVCSLFTSRPDFPVLRS